MDAPTRLFVYGSLAPGRRNAHILDPVAGFWQPATVRGRLYEPGTWSDSDYPGVVLEIEQGPSGQRLVGSMVEGQIFSSPELPEHWSRIDAFEGESYQRVHTVATVPSGRGLAVEIYVIRPHSPESR